MKYQISKATPLPPKQMRNDDALYTKVTQRLIPFLMLCYIASYLDRVNVGFAKLKMAGDLGLSDTVYGLGAGIFFLGYFIFEVPSNLVLHRIGARATISRIMVLWGLISAAMMFVTSPTSFYVLRFFLGVAEAGFFPGIILYLTYWYPAPRRARIVALFMISIAISSVIGAPFSGWIMNIMPGVQGLSNWQWLFIIEGLPSVLLGFAAYFYLDNNIHDAAWLSAEEKAVLSDNIRDELVEKQEQHKGILATLSHPRVWQLAMVYFCIVVGLYGLSFWLPTIVKAMGYKDNFAIGLMAAVPFGCSIVVSLAFSRLSDHLRERRWHVALASLAGGIGLGLSAALADNQTLAMIALCVAASGIMTALPIFWSLPTSFLAEAGAAAGIALINSLGNLAGFVGPFAVGWLKDLTHSTDIGLYALAGCMTIGALLTLSLPRRVINK